LIDISLPHRYYVQNEYSDESNNIDKHKYRHIYKWSELFMEYINRVNIDIERLYEIEINIYRNEYLTEEEKVIVSKIISEFKEYIYMIEGEEGKYKLFPLIEVSSDIHRIFMFPYHAKKKEYLYAIITNTMYIDNNNGNRNNNNKNDKDKNNEYIFVEFDIKGAIPYMYLRTYFKDTIYNEYREYIKKGYIRDIYEYIHYKVYGKLIEKEKQRNEFKRCILSFIHSFKIDFIDRYNEKYGYIYKDDNDNEILNKMIDIYNKEGEEGYKKMLFNIYQNLNEYIIDEIVKKLNGIIIYINLDGGIMIVRKDIFEKKMMEYEEVKFTIL